MNGYKGKKKKKKKRLQIRKDYNLIDKKQRVHCPGIIKASDFFKSIGNFFNSICI